MINVLKISFEIAFHFLSFQVNNIRLFYCCSIGHQQQRTSNIPQEKSNFPDIYGRKARFLKITGMTILRRRKGVSIQPEKA